MVGLEGGRLPNSHPFRWSVPFLFVIGVPFFLVVSVFGELAIHGALQAQEDMAALPDVAAAPIDRGTELPDVPDLEAQQEADLNRRLAALREACPSPQRSPRAKETAFHRRALD